MCVYRYESLNGIGVRRQVGGTLKLSGKYNRRQRSPAAAYTRQLFDGNSLQQQR
jgi:hypothetical protein